MHSFHQSRGRVFFEVLCALGMVVCCVGAWKQTGATALLGAAGVAGLYGFVRLFDLRHGKPVVAAAEPQRIDFEPQMAEPQRVVVEPVTADVVVPIAPPEERRTDDKPVDSVSRARSGRPAGGSRKSKAPKTSKATEPAPVHQADAPRLMTQAVEAPELEPARQPKAAMRDNEVEPEMTADDEFVFPSDDGPSQSHVAPLFEPEPFARMQRRAFGRRGRL